MTPAPADDLSTLVRRHGLRATPATRVVLASLQAATGAQSHEDLQQACTRQLGKPLDKVTLYRVLDRLTEVGLLARHLGQDRVARYSWQASPARHRFECAHCHQTQPLPDVPELPAALAQLAAVLQRNGLQADPASLTVQGTCERCTGAGVG